MPELRVQPSINDVRSEAFEQLVERIATLHKTALPNLLLYNFDTVPSSALPFLAWQFDLISPLWQLLVPVSQGASQDQVKRAILKLAIPLHRRRGTPGAILSALLSLGFNATIQEGQNTWGGSGWPSDQGWAVCRIIINSRTLPDPNAIGTVHWDSTIIYNLGDLVYNDISGLFSYVEFATESEAGVPPQAYSIDDVDPSLLTDIETLTQYPWKVLTPGVAQPITNLTPTDIGKIQQVFYFFGNERSWLDSIWFSLEPADDYAPVPHDVLSLTGILPNGRDSAPIPTEGAFTISPSLTFAENFVPPRVLQNKHYHQKGHLQGAMQPLVQDGPLVINGNADGSSS